MGDSYATRVTQKFQNFKRSPLSDDLLTKDNIPGVGQKGVEKLKDIGIDSPAKFAGLFLACNVDDSRFSTELKKADFPAQYIDEVVGAMKEKLRNEVQLDPTRMPGGSRNFANSLIRTNRFDEEPPNTLIPGVDRENAAKLHEAEIDTPAELIGLLLTKNRSESAFKRYLLREVGCNQSTLDRNNTVKILIERARQLIGGSSPQSQQQVPQTRPPMPRTSYRTERPGTSPSNGSSEGKRRRRAKRRKAKAGSVCAFVAFMALLVVGIMLVVGRMEGRYKKERFAIDE